MSHIVSLRSASLRALRSRPTTVVAAAAAATKCWPNVAQQQFAYSTLPSTATMENQKFKKRVRSAFHREIFFHMQDDVFIERNKYFPLDAFRSNTHHRFI